MRVAISCNIMVKLLLVWSAVGILTYILLYSPLAINKETEVAVIDEKLAYADISGDDKTNLQVANTKKVKDHLFDYSRIDTKWDKELPTIYMITPTYRRAEQIPELTRTAQTLVHVKNLVWIVAEDASAPSPEVLEYLEFLGIKYVYLRAQMPSKYAEMKPKPRGVANRNAGIQWVLENAKEGVVYFGDDDNTYDLRIFEEIRSTKKISMFPVGLLTKLGVSAPVVKNGRVIGFYDGWISKRNFPVDMAEFAINVELFLQNPEARMPFKPGYEEDGLLKALNIKVSDIEAKAENATKIWVWHTQTKKNKPALETKLSNTLKESNIVELRKLLWKGT